MDQGKMDKYFMGVAKLTAQLSHARRAKVGAVVVKDNRIISIGLNGTPHGFSNECEDIAPDGSLMTKSIVVHAEMNALCFCAKTEIETEGATIYLTLSPCPTCALAMIQSGIKRVVYLDKYRDFGGVKILEQAGIEVQHFQGQYNVVEDIQHVED